jgi:hypothetical protein
MPDILSTFPGITKAALSIAYDNGGINRFRSEADCLHELAEYIDREWLSADHTGLRTILWANLINMDRWIDELSDEQLETVCNGEETEVKAAMIAAPYGTDELLNGIFENVC